MASREPAMSVHEAPEDSPQAVDLERLGRERPPEFSSTWIEVVFLVCMIGSLSMADFVIGGFQVLLPALLEPFHIPPGSQTWPASVLTLVAGAFLFPLGRVTDMYGGYVVFNGGLAWFALWTIAGGFTQNFGVLVFCRAMEGLGTAAFLPAGISLLGTIYRPGPRKNLVFALYGAVAPLGFFLGIVLGGMAQDLLNWRWYFWLGGLILIPCCVCTLVTSPRDFTVTRKRGVKMDWWGVVTTIPGMTLFIYAVTSSSSNGWRAPQTIVTLVFGILFIAAAVYVEGWVAESPLIPADIFRVKYMKRMLVCLIFSWGIFSVFLFYSNFYIQMVLGQKALTTALWYAPWAVAGLILSILSGFILHVLPSYVLLIISGTSKVLAVLFFALLPDKPNYWAWIMPAMVFEAACVDVLWTVSNVFLTTSLPKHRQGMAGALISVTLYLGGALFLAIANVAREQFRAAGLDLKRQYKGVFWVAVGLSSVALVICLFIRLGKADSALTPEEKQEDRSVDSTFSQGRTDSEAGLMSQRLHESDSDTVIGVETESTGEKKP
ncbi:hypothetical protein HIM_00706 [Hirsutella minnesotensis 3608]|nr:hypothetical protein HIM_00706 [Hirsutella minnesotensis 3608]